LVVLALFTAARIFGGRGPGQLTARGYKRVLAQSRSDLRRMAQLSKNREPVAPKISLSKDVPPSSPTSPRDET
jgi:hypothetical protein